MQLKHPNRYLRYKNRKERKWSLVTPVRAAPVKRWWLKKEMGWESGDHDSRQLFPAIWL